MLHPVRYPNHGPHIELSLAQEALGLVHSLGWSSVRGPTRDKDEDEDEIEIQKEKTIENYGRLQPKIFSYKKNIEQKKRENIKDGDYVYAPGM
jgi:hypothetical protein